MVTIESVSPDLAEELCRKITADLPDYFGLPEANEHYAMGVRSRMNFAAKIESEPVGLISIDFPYPKNARIFWMSVLRDFHHRGIGKALAEAVFEKARSQGA